MQVITTKFLPPTNHKGSRIKAMAEAGSVTVSKDHSLSEKEAHAAAALQLMEKYEWFGELIGGVTHRGEYAWVFTNGPTASRLVKYANAFRAKQDMRWIKRVMEHEGWPLSCVHLLMQRVHRNKKEMNDES